MLFKVVHAFFGPEIMFVDLLFAVHVYQITQGQQLLVRMLEKSLQLLLLPICEVIPQVKLLVCEL